MPQQQILTTYQSLKPYPPLSDELSRLGGIDLNNADLSGSDFQGADLSHADLRNVNLSGAKLNRADLNGAVLEGANLLGADLTGANLSKMKAVGASFRSASLDRANLIDAVLDRAEITDASLWETQRAGWSIKGILCEQASWDRERYSLIKYDEGEFERAYSAKPQIVLRYPDGLEQIDVAMLPVMIERLQEEHSDSSLSLRSIQDEGHGAKVVITVDDLSGRSENEFSKEIERLQNELSYMRGQRDALKEYLGPQITEIFAMAKRQITIGTIQGPTVLEGNQHVDSITYSTNDLVEIGRLVKDLLEKSIQWTNNVAQGDIEQFEAQLIVLQNELKKRRPDQSVIIAGMQSLKNILESAAGGAIYAGTLQALVV